MSRSTDVAKPPAKNFARVKLPSGYRVNSVRRLSFMGRDIAIDLFSGKFALGMAVYAEIYSNSSPEKKLSVEAFSFDGKSVLLTKRSWGYRCLFGIDPARGAGKKKIGIEYSLGGVTQSESFTVQIAEKKFPFNPKPLDLGKYSDVDYRPTPDEAAFINRCTEKKNKVFGRTGQDRLEPALSYPRDRHYITSPFWAKRLIMRYRKKNGKRIRFRNRLNIHKGIDLRGDTGDPVYCMAGGKVVIAEPMYYEGNFIVIDHGDRIFSYYMHLHDLKVKEGDIVRAGDLIGHVGSTGLATGPHLHVSLIIQGVYVNPLSLLSLPVRE
jgi:murein DD-endopeptidase